MGYLIKAILGAALFIGGAVLFNVKLIELLETGTCASGNTPYVIARECPEGTGTAIILMMAGIFGGLLGAALFAFRGDPPWAGGREAALGGFSWGTLAWGLFFAGSGAAILVASVGDSTLPEDGRLGATIVGITFGVMGVPALLFALWVAATSLGDRDERPASSPSSPPSLSSASSGLTWGSGGSPSGSRAGGGDSISKLERLQGLRASGALTQKEFEREKSKVLSEM